MANLTKQKILTTTSELLEQQGYHATGLNQIVKESNTPRGSLYYYFPNGKEELATEAVTQRMLMMATRSQSFLAKVDDAVEAIYSFIVSLSEQMSEDGCCTGAPIAAVALEASNSSESIRKACAEGYQGLHNVLAAKLVSGGFSEEKALSLAITINASIEGATILARTKQDASIIKNIANDIKVLLDNSARV